MNGGFVFPIYKDEKLEAKSRTIVRLMLSYTLKMRPETLQTIRFYSGLSPYRITNNDILRELCWIVYTSGFRVDVVRRYWPSLKEAFHNFQVEDVASLSTNLEEEAKHICSKSQFKNLRKAKWCIENALRIIELNFEWKQIGGLKGFFSEISSKNVIDLVNLAPTIVNQLQFKGIGKVTVYHLMKNVGIDIFKPDIHVCRVLMKLGFTNSAKAPISTICKTMLFLSKTCNMKISELDTLIYSYGSLTGDLIDPLLGFLYDEDIYCNRESIPT